MKLYLVCDTSGSMSEGGKPFILRTVVMTVAQWIRFEYCQSEISLFAWSSKARYWKEWNINGDFPVEMLVCEGCVNSKALVQLLGGVPDGRVLILTDGFWSDDDVKILNGWLQGLRPDTLRVIRVGADANLHLPKSLKGIKVFTAEEVFSALDGWLHAGKELT